MQVRPDQKMVETVDPARRLAVEIEHRKRRADRAERLLQSVRDEDGARLAEVVACCGAIGVLGLDDRGECLAGAVDDACVPTSDGSSCGVVRLFASTNFSALSSKPTRISKFFYLIGGSMCR